MAYKRLQQPLLTAKQNPFFAQTHFKHTAICLEAEPINQPLQALQSLHWASDLSQVPLHQETSVVQKMDDKKGPTRVRSASGAGNLESEKGKAIECYGVSQGHYATIDKSVVAKIGTSSLASCFAVIVDNGATVFFAHVHACNETVLGNFIQLIGQPSKAIIIKGKAPSDNTNLMIEKLVALGATVSGSTSTAAVVYDTQTDSIETPNDIRATNRDYLSKNLKGSGMKKSENLNPM
jgi:hypothetical protein